MVTFENKEYFKKIKYRDPNDYVVESFVRPKIKFMEKKGCFGKKDLKILDVGSGNGTFGWYFKKYTDKVFSLDYSDHLLKLNAAKQKILATAYHLPFRDNQFDVVFEANLLHHLDSPCDAIKEMKRCSKEFLVFIEPNRYNPLMFIFSLLVTPERGVLVSYRKKWKDVIEKSDIEVVDDIVTGMISQQNTCTFLVTF